MTIVRLFVGDDGWVTKHYQVNLYRVAGIEVQSTRTLAFWVPYYRGRGWEPLTCPVDRGVECGGEVFAGEGWVGDRDRWITCRYGPAGYALRIEDSGLYHVLADGSQALQLQMDREASNVSIDDAVGGPLVMLALALQGNWCLHASAVKLAGRTVAFLGESGTGKSTLADWLAREGGVSVLRVADDILPVKAGESGLEALPHFPQLKLAADAQPALNLPERMPLDAVYVLSRPAAGELVAIQPLDGQAAVLKLVRHTAASRLFAPDLLVKHLDFCVQAAANVPVRQLSYPLTQAALPTVRKAIASDLGLA